MENAEEAPQTRKDWKFWMIVACIMLSQFLTALELVSSKFDITISASVYQSIVCSQPCLPPFLPLSATYLAISSYGLDPVRLLLFFFPVCHEFTAVLAYTLCSTAFVPLSGGLAEVRANAPSHIIC